MLSVLQAENKIYRVDRTKYLDDYWKSHCACSSPVGTTSPSSHWLESSAVWWWPNQTHATTSLWLHQ